MMVANVIALVLTDLDEKKAPEAYMGYALYDADSNLYEKGKIILGKRARNEHEELKTSIFVPKDGFMRTFLVNETSEDVWFDQFRIQTTTPIILQETHGACPESEAIRESLGCRDARPRFPAGRNQSQ